MEKTMKARVQHKHDIESSWLKATNFIPLAGEIIVYDPDENYDYPRIKIGNGETNINSLPFITEDYAKIADIPTKPADIGALPSTTKIPSTLSDLSEDATHRLVSDTEKNTWNAKAEVSAIPTNVSQLVNDSNYLTEHQDISGKLDANKLPDAINTALEQAKISGEFDGSNGISATHSWSGTTLTITSASGTSSVNLKGEKGEQGIPGIQGVQGEQGPAGYSPKRGIDYWTSEDKAEIKSYVDGAILGGEW